MDGGCVVLDASVLLTTYRDLILIFHFFRAFDVLRVSIHTSESISCGMLSTAGHKPALQQW